MKPLPGIECDAKISACEVYRYTLERWWDRSRQPLVFVLLNPSTADKETDDRTLRKGIGFAQREGAGGVVFVNLFALRSKNPAALRTHPEPVGPENDREIVKQVQPVGRAVLAWGTDGSLHGRDKRVLDLLRPYELLCLGHTKDGHPRHPVRLSPTTPLVRFRGRAVEAVAAR